MCDPPQQTDRRTDESADWTHWLRAAFHTISEATGCDVAHLLAQLVDCVNSQKFKSNAGLAGEEKG